MYKDIMDMYPFNLARAVLGKDAEEVYIPGIEETLATLTEREADILQKRFRDKMTRKRVGEVCGLSQERVRQIELKALRKLSHPSRSNKIKGVPFSELRKQNIDYQELNKKYEFLLKKLEAFADTPNFETIIAKVEEDVLYDTLIEELNLSVRAYNALVKSGLKTIGDVANLSYEKMSKIRNLGEKTAEEIITVLKTHNIEIK